MVWDYEKKFKKSVGKSVVSGLPAAAMEISMKNKTIFVPLLLALCFLLTGFTSTGEKAVSVAVVYAVTAALSAVVFLVYVFGVRKKSPWYILLFSSVFVVNIGYFSLSVSKTLEEALLANRIAYLGSVFLPMSILMIIFEVTKTKYGKALIGTLIGIGILVFLIAASPGYLDIYYKEVSLITVNGVSMLDKVYGPLHIIYLFYLLVYFISMIALITVNAVKKKQNSIIQTAILLFAVFINIMVWLLEQFVKIDFEILAVSYVVTEVFLLFLCFLVQENEKHSQCHVAVAVETEICTPQPSKEAVTEEEAAFDSENFVEFFETEQYKAFMYGKGLLTNTEQKIFNYYIEGKSTKEILVLLDITENTLKYHNKNIYGKLGVSSRKQLKEIEQRIQSLNG